MEPKKEETATSKKDEKKDFSTAILDQKKAPYRLLAEEGVGT